MNKSDSPKTEQLIKQLRKQDGLVRQQARIELVRIGEPAVGPLIEALEHRTGYTHWETAKALSQIGSPQAAQALDGIGTGLVHRLTTVPIVMTLRGA